MKNETIQFKRQIFNLTEQIADYKNEIQEKNQRVGMLEEVNLGLINNLQPQENNKMKNETILVNRTKMLDFREIIQEEVERKLQDEKQRMVNLEKSLKQTNNLIKVLLTLNFLDLRNREDEPRYDPNRNSKGKQEPKTASGRVRC